MRPIISGSFQIYLQDAGEPALSQQAEVRDGAEHVYSELLLYPHATPIYEVGSLGP